MVMVRTINQEYHQEDRELNYKEEVNNLFLYFFLSFKTSVNTDL